MNAMRVRHTFILAIMIMAWYCLSVTDNNWFATDGHVYTSSIPTPSTVVQTADTKISEPPGTDITSKGKKSTSETLNVVALVIKHPIFTLFIGLIGGGLLTSEVRRKTKRIWWNLKARTIRKCIDSDSSEKVSPYIENFWDFFRTLIGTINASRKRAGRGGGFFSDCQLRSLKLMIGSPISGHGSAYYSPDWKDQSLNVNSPKDRICELIVALDGLIKTSPSMTRKLICVSQEQLPDSIINRLKFDTEDFARNEEMRKKYTKSSSFAYEWYSEKKFSIQFSDKDIHLLIMILEDVCGRKELVTAATDVVFFEKGHNRDFKCPGFYTRRDTLIRTYEDFFDGFYDYLSDKRKKDH